MHNLLDNCSNVSSMYISNKKIYYKKLFRSIYLYIYGLRSFYYKKKFYFRPKIYFIVFEILFLGPLVVSQNKS